MQKDGINAIKEPKMVNNPPAFPSHYEILHREMIEGKVLKVLKSKDGMTLRDYFANSAMKEMIKQHGPISGEDYGTQLRSCIASESYLMANAMLKEREKENGQD